VQLFCSILVAPPVPIFMHVAAYNVLCRKQVVHASPTSVTTCATFVNSRRSGSGLVRGWMVQKSIEKRRGLVSLQLKLLDVVWRLDVG
jgi:hypothetical protein